MKQTYYFLTLLTIAMMVGGGLFAQTPCDPNGDGNPDEDEDGRGQGTGANNAAGDLAWDLLLNSTCSDSDNDIEHRIKDYDPSDNCNNSSNLIPESGFNSLKIAIIDSGIRPTSPGRFNNLPLFSHTVSPEGIVTEGVAHPHPHGTYSAGVISSMLKRHVSPIVDHSDYLLYDYQVLNGDLRTSLAAVEAAIIHATETEVHLIALSIGFVPRDCDNIDWDSPDSGLNRAIDRARQNGIIVVTSAGNDGNDLAVHPQYPAASPLSNVVSVGALSCEGEVRTSFSNYGEGIVDVFTAGDFVTVFYNGCFHAINGTSFATSIVAGKAALHLTKDNNMDRALCLLRSQTKPFFGDEQYSIYGIVDVPAISEEDICQNGESYDPNGGSDATDPNGGKEPGGTFGEGSGEGGKSGEANSKPTTGKELTVLASPNPFSDQLRVNLDVLEERATVSLLDGRGRKILSREVTQPSVQLDLGHLPAGVYWLNVRNAESTQTRKVIKK